MSNDGATNWTTIPGATDSTTYTLTGDEIGKYVRVSVSFTDGGGTEEGLFSAATAVVEKEAGPSAPSAPIEDSKTTTSITLKAVAGQEYSIDGTTWKENPTFTGLTPDTEYTFVTRVKATSTHQESAASTGTVIRTAALPLDPPDYTLGDVNQDGAINMTDVYLVYQHVKGKITLTEAQLLAANVNRDEQVNAADAQLIQSYYLKKISQFLDLS